MHVSNGRVAAPLRAVTTTNWVYSCKYYNINYGSASSGHPRADAGVYVCWMPVNAPVYPHWVQLCADAGEMRARRRHTRPSVTLPAPGTVFLIPIYELLFVICPPFLAIWVWFMHSSFNLALDISARNLLG